jgi:hypothetical protein
MGIIPPIMAHNINFKEKENVQERKEDRFAEERVFRQLVWQRRWLLPYSYHPERTGEGATQRQTGNRQRLPKELILRKTPW